MVRTATVAMLLWLGGCEQYSTPPSESPGSRAHDDPSTCVDASAAKDYSQARAMNLERAKPTQAALAKGISGLGVCAGQLEKPSSVLASVDFRADGSAERVRILRAETSDCRALECVRQKLAEVKAPVIDKGKRSAAFSFVLRTNPAPDGWEHVTWDPASESRSCTDEADNSMRAEGRRLLPTQVQQTVRGAYDEFRHCYEDGLRRDVTLRGRVAIRFHIGVDGKVTVAHVVENQLPDCAVTACIRDKMRSVIFPKAEVPTDVVYPIELEPAGAAPGPGHAGDNRTAVP